MMKKLLFLICLLTVKTVFCQDPELSEHTWYANSITLNSITTEAPKNPSMEIQATFDGTSSLTDMCCAGALNFNINYQGQSTFEISDFSPALETCDEADNNEFRDLYISFFQDATTDTFDYEIVDEVNYWDYKILTLTNANGDTVQFFDTPHDIDINGYIFDIYNGHWFLESLSNEDLFYRIPYDIAKETEISFDRDGVLKSIICGEINSKVIFNGGEYEGEFYIPCNNLTLPSGDCNNQDFIDLEQDFYTILEKITEGETLHFQRYHADFGEGNCEITEILEIYNSTRDLGFTLVDCLEPLSIENFNESLVSLYPNPVQDKLILNYKEALDSPLQITIYSIQGKEMLSQTLQPRDETSLEVSDLSSGMYFISIQNDSGTTTQKFLKF